MKHFYENFLSVALLENYYGSMILEDDIKLSYNWFEEFNFFWSGTKNYLYENWIKIMKKVRFFKFFSKFPNIIDQTDLGQFRIHSLDILWERSMEAGNMRNVF